MDKKMTENTKTKRLFILNWLGSPFVQDRMIVYYPDRGGEVVQKMVGRQTIVFCKDHFFWNFFRVLRDATINIDIRKQDDYTKYLLAFLEKRAFIEEHEIEDKEIPADCDPKTAYMQGKKIGDELITKKKELEDFDYHDAWITLDED